jgi:hypothetical protein
VSLRLVGSGLVRRDDAVVALEHLGAQHDVDPLHEVVLDESVVLDSDLVNEDVFELVRVDAVLVGATEPEDNLSQHEVFVDVEEEKAGHDLVCVYELERWDVVKYLFEHRLENLCLDFDFLEYLDHLDNDLQVLPFVRYRIFEEQLEDRALIDRILIVVKRPVLGVARTTEGGLLEVTVHLACVHRHLGLLDQSVFVALPVELLSLGVNVPDD